MIKNYVLKQKFGKKRNDKPKWKDPNPVKYGGKYGLMNLQENADDTFQENLAKYNEEQDLNRLALMTNEDIKNELDMKEVSVQHRRQEIKLQNLNETKSLNLNDTL